MLINTISPQGYASIAACIYITIAVMIGFALFFGLRARRYVKREKITAVDEGLSPLDVQRIFIGKTYPRRLTAALLAHWAKRGYIKLEYVDKNHVKITKLAAMPAHTSPDAKFFDRGTYVRERDLFSALMTQTKRKRTVAVDKPLFDKATVKDINDRYAVREDEGVFPSAHYSLKIFMLVMSVVPLALTALLIGLATGNYASFALLLTAVIGMAVLIFGRDIPVLFKAVWCGLWLGASVGGMLAFSQPLSDPAGAVYAAVAILFLGPTVLRQLVDYRSKKNLSDYSDLVNYKRYLLRATADELRDVRYADVLPYLHAFGIFRRVRRKLDCTLPPDKYVGDFSSGGLA